MNRVVALFGRIFCTLIAGGMITGLGLLFVVFAWPNYRNAKASERWPSVTGTIVKSEVKPTSDRDVGTMYAPEIRYRYIVDGREFENDRISLSNLDTTRSSDAYQLTNKFLANSTTTVYYDPAAPSKSVLINVATHDGTFIFGLVVAGTGLLIILLPLLIPLASACIPVLKIGVAIGAVGVVKAMGNSEESKRQRGVGESSTDIDKLSEAIEI